MDGRQMKMAASWSIGWQDRQLPKLFSDCCRANALGLVGRTTARASLMVWSAQLRANCKQALTRPVMMTSQRTISRTRQTVKTSERTEMPQVRKFIIVLPYVYMFSHPLFYIVILICHHHHGQCIALRKVLCIIKYVNYLQWLLISYYVIKHNDV